mmetsp:Transcript_9465/g.18116  ORF Transcript_9465/g.18116 Transcript_9465/m.18116 type:complete len:218 (+) Transcript_9465:700-1353(+)
MGPKTWRLSCNRRKRKPRKRVRPPNHRKRPNHRTARNKKNKPRLLLVVVATSLPQQTKLPIRTIFRHSIFVWARLSKPGNTKARTSYFVKTWIWEPKRVRLLPDYAPFTRRPTCKIVTCWSCAISKSEVSPVSPRTAWSCVPATPIIRQWNLSSHPKVPNLGNGSNSKVIPVNPNPKTRLPRKKCLKSWPRISKPMTRAMWYGKPSWPRRKLVLLGL